MKRQKSWKQKLKKKLKFEATKFELVKAEDLIQRGK